MEHTETAGASLVDVHAYARMSWSAIFGGWVVATGIASLMLVAGLALGFTTFDPYDAEATAKGIGMGTAAWMILTWATSLFLGGMFASWFDGRSDQTVGTLHGVTVWGLSVVASGLLLAVGLMHVVQGGAAVVRGGAMAGASAAGMGVPQMAARGPAGGPTEDAIIGLQAQLTQSMAQAGSHSAASTMPVAAVPPMQASTPGTAAAPAASGQATPVDTRRSTPQLDRQSTAAVAVALLKGHTDTAKALLAANTSLSQAEIDQTLQSLSAQVEKYKTDVQAAADATARYSAAAMWITFFSSLIALVAAAGGGWIGAGHLHRVHHPRRRYETTTSRPL
jgi:hypothetical protein